MKRERRAELVAGWCDRCGKVAHVSKAGARFARRQQRQRRPGPGLHSYRCPHNPNLWHNGTLPAAIRRGEVTRRELFGGQDG